MISKERNYLTVFLKIYGHPAIALWRSIEAKCLSHVLKRMNFDGLILDLGCGEGRVSSIIFDQNIDVGLDISKFEITKAKLTKSYGSLVV